MYAGSYTFVKYIATNTQRIRYFLPDCPFVCLSVTASVRIRRLRSDLLELKINCYVNYAGGGNITVTPTEGGYIRMRANRVHRKYRQEGKTDTPNF